jgi:1-deoxy-D-xylulose-5-phosphate synthase
MTHPLLDKINSPAELRALEREQMPQVADELRAFVLESVSKTGGHLSSNLGTVELTVALHYVFDTPEDRLVWDVGHQTYPHKALTGRRTGMERLRMKDGVSGFPASHRKRVRHLRRRALLHLDFRRPRHGGGGPQQGRGAARGGDHRRRRDVSRAGFRSLNNAGVIDANLLVILNDNDMSISPPVGALNKYLARLLSGGTFNAARRAGEKVLSAMPNVLQFANRVEEHVKGMISPGTLFEELGFNYIGPIDGHDLDALIPTLQNLRRLKGPQFLHVITRKGQGYKLAEADPILYHGVGKFDAVNGIEQGKSAGRPTYTQVFGDWLCDQAKADPRLVGITPAMREGSGMVRFAGEFPQRYFDVGIAEQHAVTFAGGLACEGMRPVVAIYSTFLQRAYDQLIHDIALQNLPVVFAIDRGGLVGADGATHNGAFDLSYLSCIPNMVVMAPGDENECRKMLSTAVTLDGPSAVRYPRGSGPGTAIEPGLATLPLGKGEVRRHGKRVALLAFGSMLTPALKAGEALDATVANMRFIKPLDTELVRQLAADHELLVSIEENALIGGAGAEVARALEEAGLDVPLLRLGLPDHFVDHGDSALLLAEVGLDEAGIRRSVTEKLSAKSNT